MAASEDKQHDRDVQAELHSCIEALRAALLASTAGDDSPNPARRGAPRVVWQRACAAMADAVAIVSDDPATVAAARVSATAASPAGETGEAGEAGPWPEVADRPTTGDLLLSVEVVAGVLDAHLGSGPSGAGPQSH